MEGDARVDRSRLMNHGLPGLNDDLAGEVRPSTMKAVRIHSYGGPEVLAYEDAPRPTIAKGEALVRVHAAAVNPVDWKVREGMRRTLGHELPLILGWDLSGVVEEVDPDVPNLRAGDVVYALADRMRDGAYAEYVALWAADVALKPRSLDHVQAAAVPLAALTAWQSLFGAADLQAGQTVLIHAAAGGVGSYAVQLAKWKGARAVGTASSRNVAFLRELGADEAIDYTSARFEDAVREVDVVLDTIGGDTRARSWGVLKPDGILVSIVPPPPSEAEGAGRGVRAKYAFVRPSAAQLTEIAGLIDAGHVRPFVQTVLPLREARQAQEMSRAGHTRGKIVLEVAAARP